MVNQFIVAAITFMVVTITIIMFNITFMVVTITIIRFNITFSNHLHMMARCGGQGDLLAGSLATFLHWAMNLSQPPASPLLAGSDH